ncbi:MAG: GntR family transcriptional regulator [Micromonosporaceae bacterium]
MSEVPDRLGSRPVDLVDRIRAAIVHGDLLPGQHLVEQDLAAKFTASRGAVRSALGVLEHDGLVTRERNRGARVRPITVAEAVEITEVRAVVEGLCAAKAAQRATAGERAELSLMESHMLAAVEAGDTDRYRVLSERVHIAIWEIAGQATALDVLDRLRYRSVRYQFSVALLPERPRQGTEEHAAIIRAVVEGDADKAERLMRTHLESVIGAIYDLQSQGLIDNHQVLSRWGEHR